MNYHLNKILKIKYPYYYLFYLFIRKREILYSTYVLIKWIMNEQKI